MRLTSDCNMGQSPRSWRFRPNGAGIAKQEGSRFDSLENGLISLTRIDTASSDNIDAYAEDRSLVERLVRGDALAWQAFVHTHGRLVRSRVADVASTFGRSEDDSAIDDATAEVFAALLGNNAAALRAFAGRSSLGTYVAVIATQSATRGFARKRLVVASVNETDLHQTQPDRSADPVNRLMHEEQRQRVREILERLPPRQRTVVRMFHLQGKSYAQISDQLQMPIGSIGPTLRRAEAKMRQWMEHE